MCALNPPALSRPTVDLLETLDAASRGQLKRREDLGVLLELGSQPGRASTLEELAFHAKFLTRALGIMQRIGRDGTGYERVEAEFTASTSVARGHLQALLDGAPEDVRERLASTYLTMSASGIGNLMELMNDLSWYKNWLLDSRHGHA
jgi:hypothetical protein